MVTGLRDLTEGERKQLSQLLAPYLEEKRQADRFISAVGGAFLAALGFPPDLHIDLDTGAVRLRETGYPIAPSLNGKAPAVPSAEDKVISPGMTEEGVL